jgi:Tol biopolymer transport system component
VVSDQTETEIIWSPDGALIAYVSSTDLYGVYVAPVSGDSAPKKLSNLGYERLVGWSPDGQFVYYAIPAASDDETFVLRAVDVDSGATQDVLTVDNLARKAPLLQVSLDGKWVAYRVNIDNSLYLKAMDGQSPARLLIDNPGLAISGISWESTSHLLGVSLQDPQSQNGAVILLNPFNCELYRVPGLDGEINGLHLP